MRSILFFLILVCFINHLIAQKVVNEEIPLSWRDFEVGASITIELFSKAPGSEARKSQTKTVFQQSAESHFTGYFDRDGFKKARSVRPVDGFSPQQIGFKEIRVTQGQISIAGKTYQAKITTLGMENVKGKRELVLWEVKELNLHSRTMGMPGVDLLLNAHIVKAQFSLFAKGFTQKTQRQVVKFEEKITIGKKEVSCLVEEAEFGIERGGMKLKGMGTHWTSADVPGRDVKRIEKGKFSQDSAQWPGEEIIEKYILIDFEARKKTVTEKK